jgi:hypothetical protein
MVATRDDLGVGDSASLEERWNRRPLLRCAVLDRYFDPARPIHVAGGVNPRLRTDRVAEQIGQSGGLSIQCKRGDLCHLLNHPRVGGDHQDHRCEHAAALAPRRLRCLCLPRRNRPEVNAGFAGPRQLGRLGI